MPIGVPPSRTTIAVSPRSSIRKASSTGVSAATVPKGGSIAAATGLATIPGSR